MNIIIINIVIHNIDLNNQMKGDQFYTTCFLKFHECVEAMERVKTLGK